MWFFDVVKLHSFILPVGASAASRRRKVYYKVVEKDISELPNIWKLKIKQTIKQRLAREPELYGKPLRKSLKGYWKLRVSDYRVVFRIEKKAIKILVIAHRSTVYVVAKKRLQSDNFKHERSF